MSRARETIEVPLAPEGAEALWTDVGRWPAFVEGFRHALHVSPEWPLPGSRVVWESIPGGRGRVTEKIVDRALGSHVVSDVSEERMTGRQAVRFAESAGGTLVEIELDYELAGRGPLQAIANALFIRRAISDSLARTLVRFAAEAAEQAADG